MPTAYKAAQAAKATPTAKSAQAAKAAKEEPAQATKKGTHIADIQAVVDACRSLQVEAVIAEVDASKLGATLDTAKVQVKSAEVGTSKADATLDAAQVKVATDIAPSVAGAPETTLACAETQLAQVEENDIAFCSICKTHFPEHFMTTGGKYTYRCQACNSTRVRLARVLKEHPSIEKPPDLGDAIRACRSEYGDDLVATCRATFTVTRTIESKVTMAGTGIFMDESDLDAKYKDKPTRLAAIKRNTKTFYCEIGEVHLYEDMSYKSGQEKAASSKRTSEALIDDINIKKLKPSKVKKQQAIQDETPLAIGDKPPPPPKLLSEKQKKLIAKMSTDLACQSQKLTETLQPLYSPTENSWVAFVPPYILGQADLAFAEKNNVLSALELALENASGNMKQISQTVNDAKDKLKTSIRRATLQMSEAQEMSSEACMS
jgi:hypothetical protein